MSQGELLQFGSSGDWNIRRARPVREAREMGQSAWLDHHASSPYRDDRGVSMDAVRMRPVRP